ncbi:MAG: hypothetical protein AMK70_02540 [Nitrospira bacterium SG8_35_1]|nr:MAG: hypothetical protein AMK70_02540 [Nitrospira bacterium SG8_35_1]
MQYTNLGNTGLIVSRIAFGAMTFGEGTLAGELQTNINQKQAIKMIGGTLDPDPAWIQPMGYGMKITEGLS